MAKNDNLLMYGLVAAGVYFFFIKPKGAATTAFTPSAPVYNPAVNTNPASNAILSPAATQALVTQGTSVLTNLIKNWTSPGPVVATIAPTANTVDATGTMYNNPTSLEQQFQSGMFNPNMTFDPSSMDNLAGIGFLREELNG